MTLLQTGFDIVYNDMPFTDVLLIFLGVGIIFVIYLLRKLPIFNILWMFLVGIFVYAMIGYAGKKVKDWWKSE